MGKRLDVDGELEREAIKAEVGEVMLICVTLC
jgi:hypothetical protein